ncbi:hypothetical protein [Gloeocapsa sp. PCC 73106]|uniref:hypothetical protein n=1 Tax=Gloeocapsa sp. PCC 73106 TaxID=102232 RepID=UPI0002ABFCA0|nr:hypothetical protein [Gloeocapsa sp. PCC 73106]ELR96283.1 hypothetical protein GLO73106DRAFT_00000720 [Gloeocapsa sp. PCC 73106]
MYHSIPRRTEELIALSQNPIDEELIATVIAGVIAIARTQGQSLDELRDELLQEDTLLSQNQRAQLSVLITQAWQTLK